LEIFPDSVRTIAQKLRYVFLCRGFADETSFGVAYPDEKENLASA
jgi:hypothetical protein